MRNSTVKGFTLIELIVVIAIIGVLAAILVPSMIGYIGDSKLATANSNAKLAFENAATICTKCETAGYPVPSSVSLSNYALPTAVPTDANIAAPTTTPNTAYIQTEIGKLMQRGNVSISFAAAGFPSNAKYAKTGADPYVGQYPTATTKKGEVTL
ncbi:MAG: type II secretion system protein [Oribacterium sp.]|nr:type II secretion system protein [Oribacterium sp.]